MSSITSIIAGKLADQAQSCVPIDDKGLECYRGEPVRAVKSDGNNAVDGVESLIAMGRTLQDFAISLANIVAGKSQ